LADWETSIPVTGRFTFQNMKSWIYALFFFNSGKDKRTLLKVVQLRAFLRKPWVILDIPLLRKLLIIILHSYQLKLFSKNSLYRSSMKASINW
jgi:hypothetical protein